MTFTQNEFPLAKVNAWNTEWFEKELAKVGFQERIDAAIKDTNDPLSVMHTLAMVTSSATERGYITKEIGNNIATQIKGKLDARAAAHPNLAASLRSLRVTVHNCERNPDTERWTGRVILLDPNRPMGVHPIYGFTVDDLEHWPTDIDFTRLLVLLR